MAQFRYIKILTLFLGLGEQSKEIKYSSLNPRWDFVCPGIPLSLGANCEVSSFLRLPIS